MSDGKEPTFMEYWATSSDEDDSSDEVSIASDCIGFHFPCLDWVTHSQ